MLSESPQVKALYKLHRKPLRAMLRRHLIGGVLMIVGFLLLAGVNLTHTLPLYAGFLFLGVPFMAITLLGTDRGDGTLEFLCSLPVVGRQLALGRVAGILEACTVAGLFTAASLLIFMSDRVEMWQVVAAGLAGFLGATVLMLASSASMLWLALRFRPETIAAALPLGLLAGFLVVRPFLPPSLEGIWMAFLGLEGGLVPLLSGIALLSALQGLIAFHLLARAFDRCVDDPSLARTLSNRSSQ